jgi:hypothetical protein
VQSKVPSKKGVLEENNGVSGLDMLCSKSSINHQY